MPLFRHAVTFFIHHYKFEALDIPQIKNYYLTPLQALFPPGGKVPKAVHGESFDEGKSACNTGYKAMALE